MSETKHTTRGISEEKFPEIFQKVEAKDLYMYADELERSVKAPATLEEGIQMMYEADRFIREYRDLIIQTKLTDEAKAHEMFHKASAIRFMTEAYEVGVKELIFAALAKGEEVYIPVFRFDGQISNLGNVRKMSDKSIVEKYLIDGEDVFDLDLVYGENEGVKNTFEVKSLFDNILNSIAEGRDGEDEDEYDDDDDYWQD
jgi:hypothetical protein